MTPSIIALTMAAVFVIGLWLGSTLPWSKSKVAVQDCTEYFGFDGVAEDPISEPWTEPFDMNRLWNAICEVESGGNPNAHNRKENALGIAQIRPILVDDCNRIAGRKRWAHAQARSPSRSRAMFEYYLKHYCKPLSYERAARNWNGGPNGHLKEATKKYWDRVKRILDNQK